VSKLRGAPPDRTDEKDKSVSPQALAWWYGLMGFGGFAFGLFAERRPFGPDVLAHPLVVFFIVVGVALLILRVALARPVPDVIPERKLLTGCCIGLAGFLVGNGAGVYVPGLLKF